MSTTLVHSTLALLALGTLLNQKARRQLLLRSRSEWLIDGTSLGLHFFVLPIVQVWMIHALFRQIAPSFEKSVSAPAWLSMLLHAALDYAWYWNHRLFHAETPLWSLHSVHHSAEKLDFFATTRNSVGSHFLMVYFWFVALAIFLLKDPSVFLALGGLGLIVNFWGHTEFNFAFNSLIDRIFSSVLITPREHYWHHSRENSRCNFGTVFSIWDRIHGTYYRRQDLPGELGTKLNMSLARQLLFP